jgi:hypothetical protein
MSFPCDLKTPKSISGSESYMSRNSADRGKAHVLTEADDDTRDVTESDGELDFDDDDMPTISDEISSSDDL